MHAIALAGRHVETSRWMNSVLNLIGIPEDVLRRYRHWDSREPASIEYEGSLLRGERPGLLIAKSFGTHVAALAHEKENFRPGAAILIGTPFSPMNAQELWRFRSFAAHQPTLFIQQDADPGGSAASLKKHLGLETGDVVSTPGSDHLYDNVHELAAIILAWPQFTQLRTF